MSPTADALAATATAALTVNAEWLAWMLTHVHGEHLDEEHRPGTDPALTSGYRPTRQLSQTSTWVR